MTFGFPAYHTEQCAIGATVPDWHSVVKETFGALSWSVREETRDEIVGSTSLNLRSWGEKVLVKSLPDNTISVTSKCALPTQCMDWGKNKKNVRRFIAEFKRHI